MFKKSLVALALVTTAVVASSSHEAVAAQNQSQVICGENSQGFPVCTGYIGESGSGGASELAYSAWLPNGGWTEVYDDGDWWVDHNPDGSTTIGFDDAAGANYFAGPKLFDAPGNYQGKSKPSSSGKSTWKGPKRSLTQLKASATVKTGAFTALSPASGQVPVPASPMLAPSVEVSFAGTGQCKGFLLVSKDGKAISAAAQAYTFPSKKAVLLPRATGKYKIELVGNSGCMGLKRSTEVNVYFPRAAGR
jgi:hypothetical protein